MVEFTTASSGVRIAYDRLGAGAPLVLAGGAAQFRAVWPAADDLARRLAERGLDVVHHDRPGRGDSGDAEPADLEGEVAAIAALLEVLGGRAALFGSSSGGAIALAAAARLPGVTHVVTWEVPLGAELGEDGAAYLAAVRAHADDPEAAFRTYMDGMPPEWFESLRNSEEWPLYARMAPTLQADAEALAWTQSAPRRELWATIAAPVLALVGEDTFPFMVDAAEALVAALPRAKHRVIPGSGHGWEPGAMADSVAEFVLH